MFPRTRNKNCSLQDAKYFLHILQKQTPSSKIEPSFFLIAPRPRSEVIVLSMAGGDRAISYEVITLTLQVKIFTAAPSRQRQSGINHCEISHGGQFFPIASRLVYARAVATVDLSSNAIVLNEHRGAKRLNLPREKRDYSLPTIGHLLYVM